MLAGVVVFVFDCGVLVVGGWRLDGGGLLMWLVEVGRRWSPAAVVFVVVAGGLAVVGGC